MKSAEIHLELFTFSFLKLKNGIGPYTIVAGIVLIIWIPIMLTGHEQIEVATHIKFLLALPVLLLAPYYLKNKLQIIVRHFIESGIVKKSEQEILLSEVQKVQDLKNSHKTLLAIVILVYIAIIFAKSSEIAPPNLWHLLIGQAFYSFAQLYIIFNGLLWFKLLFEISRLDLQLKASNGDDTGGLIFLENSIKSLYLIVLALAGSFAPGAYKLVLKQQFEIDQLLVSILILTIVFSFIFVLPLLFFTGTLVNIKKKSVRSYGLLSALQLERFEKKWINNQISYDEDELTNSNEFSSVADNIAIMNTVYRMKVIPLTQKTYLGFILCIVIPFLPALTLKVKWDIILKQLLHLVL